MSAKHKMHATNTWAVSVFRYFFAQIKWPDKVLVELDRFTRKTSQRVRVHHQVYPLNACTSSLLTVAEACATSVDNLRKPIVYGLAVSYSSKKVEVFKVT